MLQYSARITSQDTPRVGGRNLLVGERFSKETTPSREIWLGDITSIIDNNNLIGETVTWSFDLKCDKAYTFDVYQLGKIWFTDYKIVAVEAGKWKRFSFTGVVRDTHNPTGSTSRSCTLAVYGKYGSGYYPITRHHKLERGSISTDWALAPEDVAESVDKVSTSLVSLASTLLDPNEGDIPQLIRQQDLLANSVKDKADKLELANSVSSLQGEIDKRALGLHLDNAFAYIENIVKEIDSSRSYTISDSGYISSSVHNSCRNVSKEVTPYSTVCRIPNTQPQIRLTLRSDHDALKRQVDTLTAQLAQLQATTKITPVLNTDTRKRSGSTTLYPQYGDWLLTSDSQEQYISFSGLSAEIGRSIYIQTRRKAYLYANNQSFYGLPGTSSSVAVNQWLANNTTYRFLRADATTWFVTSSASPYPWT